MNVGEERWFSFCKKVATQTSIFDEWVDEFQPTSFPSSTRCSRNKGNSFLDSHSWYYLLRLFTCECSVYNNRELPRQPLPLPQLATPSSKSPLGFNFSSSQGSGFTILVSCLIFFFCFLQSTHLNPPKHELLVYCRRWLIACPIRLFS